MAEDRVHRGDAAFDDARLGFRVAEAIAVVSDLASGARLTVPHSDIPVMHVVLSGEVLFTCEDSLDRAAAGDIIYCNYGHPHGVAAMGQPVSGEQPIAWPALTAWNTEVPAAPSGTAASLLSFKLHISYLPPSTQSIRVFPPLWITRRHDEDSRLQALGLDLGQLRELCSGPGASSFLTNVASLLFVHGMRAMYRHRWASEPDDLPATGQRRIAAALLAMERYPDRNWTIDRLAQTVGCSRSTFAAIFKKATGESPHQFLTRERMEKALKLLTTSALSVEDVARRSGYPLRASFSRQFIAHFGVSPASLRRTQAEKGSKTGY